MAKPHTLAIFCGILLILLGSIVLFGWVFHVPSMVQLKTGMVAMVANSALCFILIGITFLYINIHGPDNNYVKITLLGVIATISALSIIENIFNINLGLNNLIVKPWLLDPNPTPGRMALNTSLAFLLISTVIFLFPYAHKKHVASVIQILNFGVFLMALLGIIIYSLKIEEIYSAYTYTRMAFHTAIGLVIASAGNWLTYKNYDWYINYYKNNPHRKILTVIGAFLVCVSMIAAFGDMAIVSYRTIKNIEAGLQHTLQEKVSLFNLSLKSFIHDAEVTIDDPTIKNILTTNQNDPTALKQRMSLLSERGYSALKIENKEGKILWQHGNFITNPEIKLPMNYQHNPIILWDNGFVLHTNIPIKDAQGNEIGNFVGEKKLDYFNSNYTNYYELKNTGEILICGKITNDNYTCFPSRNSNTAIAVPGEINDKAKPIALALDGMTGISNNFDYRNTRVIAAYGPLDKLGLGIIVKIDAAEIYKPLHEDLLVSMIIAIGLVTIGLLLLRWQISPLVNKLITSEKIANIANAKLQASEDRYEVAINSSNTGLWDWEIKTNNIYFSPYFKYLIGYMDDEFPNDIEAYKALIHPDDKERVINNIKNHLFTDQPYDIEYRIRKKSGEYHWYHAIGQATRELDGSPIRMAGSLTDITERKKAESRLGMQYELTKVLSEATNIETVAPEIISILREGFHWSFGAIWIVDKEHHVLCCLASSCIKELEHSRFKEMTETLTFAMGSGLPGRVWETGKPDWIEDTQEETNFLRIEAAREARLHSAFCFPIVLHGSILGVIEFFSLEKQTSEKDIFKTTSVIGDQIAQFIQRTDFMFEIKENEAHMAAILASASDSIITMDQQGNILTYNPQTMKMFNIYDVNLSRKNISMLIPDLTTQRMNDILDQPPVEFNTIDGDVHTFSLEITISSMMINDKKMFVAIIRDISERKKIEKLKNEFVSVVSHELRTPLTSIRGALTLLLSGNLGKFEENAIKFLQIANNNCDRLLNLINDILDIEKIEAGKMSFTMKQVDIARLVHDAISSNQMYGEKYNVKIELRNSVRNIFVNADPDRLMQVLSNLISNAVKFSPAGGKVEIDVTQINETIRVAVIDKGAGISEDFKSKIFLKFSQADSSSTRKSGGTGLGLNITKAMIEKMGGTINFVSKVNQGSIFYFDLPIVREKVSLEE